MENDDLYSLQKLASGDFILNTIYEWQYIQNEKVVTTQNGNECPYKLIKHHILANAIAGSVYHGDVATQTFHSNYKENKMEISDVPHEGDYPKITEVKINGEKGILHINWDRPVKADKHNLVVSYEYSYSENHYTENQ